MMNQLKELLNEGGVSVDKDVITSVEEEVVDTEFANNDDKKDTEEKKCPKCDKPESECECDKDTDDDKKKFAKDDEEKCPECGKQKDECTCESKKEDKKDKYNLNEIPEYMELVENYDTLQSQYAALESEIAGLREFKASAERKDKEAMIESFYMLSDEDKKDVVDNIDTYSLDDIEAKLSIICVRNKVSFNLDDDKEEDDKQDVITYSVDQDVDDANVPAWVKAMRNVAKDM